VQHGDHIDYLHDGHAHHSDADHYDECPIGDVHALSEAHEHTHAADCGHATVQHGDHIDYVHDGHRHAAHNDHYDEH
jgi:hypothetical protein